MFHAKKTYKNYGSVYLSLHVCREQTEIDKDSEPSGNYHFVFPPTI